jgi:hypothetical protein
VLFIDLTTWMAHETGVKINDHVLGPLYSPDAAALWWADPAWRDRADDHTASAASGGAVVMRSAPSASTRLL